MILAVLIAGIGCSNVCAEQLHTLEDLVRKAISTSPELLALAEERSERKANLDTSRARRLPKVQFLNTYSYDVNPPSGYTVGVGELGSIPTGPTTFIDLPEEEIVIFEDQDHFLYSFGLQLDQPLFTWGKLKGGIAIGEALVGLKNLEAEMKRSDLATEVASHMYTYYFLSSIVDQLNEQNELGERILAIAEGSHESGQLSESELIETRMRVREISHAKVSTEQKMQRSLIDLRFLTGMQTLKYTDFSFAGFDEILVSHQLEPDYTSNALEGNKSILIGRAASALEAQRLEVARGAANLRPDMGLAVQLGYRGSKLPWFDDDWTSGSDYAAILSISISTTMYDGGGAAAEISAAESRVRQSAYRLENIRWEVSHFVMQTIHELSSLSETIRYHESRRHDAVELAAYQLELLELGGGSQLEYLNRKVAMIGEGIKVMEYQLSYALRHISLMNAVGSAVER